MTVRGVRNSCDTLATKSICVPSASWRERRVLRTSTMPGCVSIKTLRNIATARFRVREAETVASKRAGTEPGVSNTQRSGCEEGREISPLTFPAD